MSSINTVANPLIWDENTILSQSKPFLDRKEKELNGYFQIWKASLGTDPYTSSARSNGREFKAVVEDAVQEITVLNAAVEELSDQENAKNPQSEKALQLAKINTVSDAALNYYTSLIDHLPFPTYYNETIDQSWNTGIKLSLSGAVLGLATLIAESTSPIELPIKPLTIFLASMAPFCAAAAVKGLNQVVNVNPGIAKVQEMREIYKKALG